MSKKRPSILFPLEIHVLDKQDKSKYPLRLLRDFACLYDNKLIVPPMGYDTDFASIPTKWLKRRLEPQKLIACKEYKSGIKYSVWVYHLDSNGKPVLVGYIVDPVAYAAVIHDWLYSTECVSRAYADRVFYDILHHANVKWDWLMYAGVRVGGWPSYPHKKSEVSEDRALGREAYKRVQKILLTSNEPLLEIANA